MVQAAATEAPRAKGSILARLGWGFAVLALLLGAFVALTLWSWIAAQRELERVEQSFRQLETARTIEAAFNRYLVGEVARRISGRERQGEEAAEVRRALLDYRSMIGAEIASSGSADELDAERGELIRSGALDELFAAIETEALLGRSRDAAPDERVRLFLDQIAAERDRRFRAILFEISADERGEIATAAAGLRAIRARTIWFGSAIGLAFLAVGAIFGLFLRDGLRRPIRALSRAAVDFGSGERDARAPAGMPGEFSLLANSFNRMAGELAAREAALEDDVAARTEALAAANEELRHIDAARRRFFANVSHELRTPVTVLLGEAQLALRRPEDRQALREALERIDASGGFLRRRLDDLMRLARSEEGQLELDRGETSFPRPVVEAIELARGYAEANEVTLVHQLPDPVVIVADGDALRQAALALIDNAIKFSPPGGTVSVAAEIVEGRVCFTVSDEGSGFTGDAQTVLDRYAQEGQGRAAGGSGLGLAIARWIAEEHGGTLVAANRAEGGAAVTLSVPR